MLWELPELEAALAEHLENAGVRALLNGAAAPPSVPGGAAFGAVVAFFLDRLPILDEDEHW